MVFLIWSLIGSSLSWIVLRLYSVVIQRHRLSAGAVRCCPCVPSQRCSVLPCEPCGGGRAMGDTGAGAPPRPLTSVICPVCIVGVFRGRVRRPALSGRPGFGSVCVSLFHVKNPVQRTRNHQRRRSLSGVVAVQAFAKVTKGSDGARFAHEGKGAWKKKGKQTWCGKLPLVCFPAGCAHYRTVPQVPLCLRREVEITAKCLLARTSLIWNYRLELHKLFPNKYCIIKLKDPPKNGQIRDKANRAKCLFKKLGSGCIGVNM